MSDERLRVDFYFDVMCPWAYQTSKWIREVRAQSGLEIDWKFFSLEEVNRLEGKKHPWERPWSYGWSLLRIGALLRRKSMHDLDRFYAGAGQALHEEGRKVHLPEGAKEVLSELGFDPQLVDEALADQSTHDEVHTDHNTVIEKGGFGVPTLVFPDGSVLFGPVVTPAPTGRDAMRLWELTVGWTEFPHLYEMRRTKTQADFAHIDRQFDTYYNARDWKTIQNPAP
jgi:2-hydroxychromene-2-carboxylate isomerase